MNTRLVFSISLFLATISPLSAQNSSSSQAVGDASGRIEQYQQESKKLDPQSIFNELERLRTIIALKRQDHAWPDLTDDDTLKATAYAMALETKRKLRDPAASYYWGIYNARICGALDASKISGAPSAQCWSDTLESFKIANEGGILRASLNVGLMYENGWGVPKSRYVAADWYFKAADKFSLVGEREGALEALEATIRMVPDHPAATRLRAQLQR
ncbi:hypothetical protein [Pseudoduganella sp. HUAS MS19]